MPAEPTIRPSSKATIPVIPSGGFSIFLRHCSLLVKGSLNVPHRTFGSSISTATSCQSLGSRARIVNPSRRGGVPLRGSTYLVSVREFGTFVLRCCGGPAERANKKAPSEVGGAGKRSCHLRQRTTSLTGVRRGKAALSSGCKSHPANRSSRKQ